MGFQIYQAPSLFFRLLSFGNVLMWKNECEKIRTIFPAALTEINMSLRQTANFTV